MIGTSGLRILVDSKVDYSKSKNLILTSVIFVTGLSGITLKFGSLELKGMVLACIVGMLLSLIFYVCENSISPTTTRTPLRKRRKMRPPLNKL